MVWKALKNHNLLNIVAKLGKPLNKHSGPYVEIYLASYILVKFNYW